MKSFENINILIKVKLFCLKNICVGESFYLKKYDFENKKKIKKLFFLKQKLLFERKKLLKKKFCLEKILFLKTKNFFFQFFFNPDA